MFSSELLSSGLTSKFTMLLICRHINYSHQLHRSQETKDTRSFQSESDTGFLSVSADLTKQKKKKKNLADLLPVAVFDAGVTDGGQDG